MSDVNEPRDTGSSLRALNIAGVVVGTWKEHYRQAVLGGESLVRLMRSGMAAVEQSTDTALQSRIATERFLTPSALCDLLDAYGVPVPGDESTMPLIRRNTRLGVTLSGRY